VGLAVQVRALGAEVPVCALSDQEFVQLPAGLGVPLVPIGQPARLPVTKATTPSAVDLPPRAAEECDAPVASRVMPTGGW
jgi:vancomycin aglycone glucosyltransferase